VEERERERKEVLRGREETQRGGRVTVDLREVFPAQIHRQKEQHAREKIVHLFAKNDDFFREQQQQLLFLVPVRPGLAPASSDD